MPGQPRSLRSQGTAVAMAWEFILQTLWFPVRGCVLKGKRDSIKKSLVLVGFIMRQVPGSLQRPFSAHSIAVAKSRFVSLTQGWWMVGSRLGGSLKAVSMDWTVGVKRNPSKSWTSSLISVEVGLSSGCLLVSLRSTAVHLCSPWSPLLD